MMFNVHNDTGDRLEGYFVPNSMSAEARIRVTGQGELLYIGSCDAVIEDLVRVGRHQTGLAAFTVDTHHVRHLPDIVDLCVWDADTDFLIYRRNRTDQYMQRRVFRLETTLAAPLHYTECLAPHFAYSLSDVHLYGQETLSQLFNLNNYPSMYFEGRTHIKSHQKYLHDSIYSIVSIDDPFVTLALTLQQVCQGVEAIGAMVDERELSALLPLIVYLDGIDAEHPHQLRKALRNAPKAALAPLTAPLVGLLTGQTPGVGGSQRDIPAALNTLSMFDTVLLGTETPHQNASLERDLGLRANTVPVLTHSPQVHALADALRDISSLQTALENDLIVYHCLTQANLNIQEEAVLVFQTIRDHLRDHI